MPMDLALQYFNYIVLSAAETWIGYRLFNTYLTRNKINQHFYYIGVLVYFSFQMFSYINECPMFSTAAYYFIFSLAIACIFFADSLQNKITIAALFVIMNYGSKAVVTALAIAQNWQLIPNDLSNYQLVMNPLTQMLSCLFFVLLLGGTIYIRQLRLRRQNLLYAALSYLFPLTVMIAVIFASTRPFVGVIGVQTDIQVFYTGTALLLFSASVSLFYLLEKNILLDMSSEKSAIMEEMLSLQRRHYERLEFSQKETQSLRHDMKKHLRCCYTLLEEGHTEEAQHYIRTLYHENKKLRGITYSGNIVIDSILSNGFANIEQSGIDLKCSVVAPPSLNIADVDLCILFGNLIDNAVEACERIVDPSIPRQIILNVNIKRDYLFVDITNSFTGEIIKSNNIYKTVKSNERYCGIGLFNIEKIVEKYNGEMSINHDANTFNVSIILSLLEQAKA